METLVRRVDREGQAPGPAKGVSITRGIAAAALCLFWVTVES